MNRIDQYVREKECAIITAWRDTLKDVTNSTVIPTHISHRKGNRGVKVIGIPFKVGENFSTEEKKYCNRDSFMCSPKGSSDGYLIGTNAFDFPVYGNEVPSGAFHRDVQSMFMNRIGNKGFSFSNGEKVAKDDPKRMEKLNNGDNNYETGEPMTFQDRKRKRIENNGKELSNESVERFLQIETFKHASIGAKHAIMLCARGLKK